MAHNQTGMEILDQCPGKIDVFVTSIGTGGTLKGVSEVLRKANPDVRIVGIEPAATRKKMVPGSNWERSEVNGGLIADLVETKGLVDEIVSVGDEEAISMAQCLRKEGYLVGISSGANALVALNEAKKINIGNVVTIFPDSINRYFTEEHYVT